VPVDGRDVGQGSPRCSAETLSACRRATRLRVRSGGATLGCPLVPPLPTSQVDVVLDFASQVARAMQTWSPPSWSVLAQASRIRDARRGAAGARATHCVAVTGRLEFLRYTEQTVLAAAPSGVSDPARDAVTDAVLGALLADVLPLEDYAALTRPILAATADERG